MHPPAALGHRLWEGLIVVTTTVAVLWIPIDLVGGLLVEAYHGVIGWTVTVIFALDVGVRARRMQAEGGLGATLLLDVLAALPLTLLLCPTVLEVLWLLKYYRVAQSMRRWRRRQLRSLNAVRLGFFIYGLALTTHWITCGWVALRGLNIDLSPEARYVDALYWCVTTLTTVGYGDVVPTTTPEKLYAIGVMMLGVGVYAYLIGNIASTIANLDPARAAFTRHAERVEAFMHYRKLPPALRRRIHDYYTYLWTQRRGFDETKVVATLPPSLRTDIALFLKRDLLDQVPLFQGASEAFIRQVALHMEPVVFMPSDTIIQAGARGQEMFFISKGQVEVRAPDGQTVYNTLGDGDFFGEIALFFDARRTATVTALTYCDCYCLDKRMFDDVLAHFPDIAAELERRAHERYGQDAPSSFDLDS